MPASVTWTCNSNHVIFLTYSQANDINVSDIQSHLDTLGSDQHVVGHELHGDGGHHYHCIVHFGDVQRWRDARVFDVNGVHPNVEFGKSRGSVGRIYAYITKDGDTYPSSEDADDFFATLAEESAGKRTRNDIWGEILGATTQAEFLALVKANAPYDYATKYDALVSYAGQHYNKTPYVAPDVTWAPSETMDDMNAWVDEFLVCVYLSDAADFVETRSPRRRSTQGPYPCRPD